MHAVARYVSHIVLCTGKFIDFKQKWPRQESNPQPSDLESDALPLRHATVNQTLHSRRQI